MAGAAVGAVAVGPATAGATAADAAGRVLRRRVVCRQVVWRRVWVWRQASLRLPQACPPHPARHPSFHFNSVQFVASKLLWIGKK